MATFPGFMARVVVESVLACSAEEAWERLVTSAHLLEICRPMVVIRPMSGESFPDRWQPGSRFRVRSSLFGVIPLGSRELEFETVDPSNRLIQTREHDPLVRRWDHRMQIEPLGPGQCRHTDDITVEAGLLTPAVWLFAQTFYRHRHRRWRRIAQYKSKQ